MLMQKILRTAKYHKSTRISCFVRNVQQCVAEEHLTTMKVDVPAQTEKDPKREPFLKNMFLAKFDLDLLAFPEPHSTERFKFFCDWLKPLQDFITANNGPTNTETSTEQLFNALKDIGIFSTNIEEKYNGLNFSEMETAKFLETIGSVPWLSSYLRSNICVSKLISKYGTEEQKAYYLPKIASKELVPTICITEHSSGPNLKTIKSTAVLSDTGDSWTINGEKIYVANAEESNLFVVLAHCTEQENVSYIFENLTFFLVENTTKGVTCTNDVETIGQKDVHMCSVKFENVSIPKHNKLSEIGNGIYILNDILAPGKSNTAGLAIGLLKNFINLVVLNILGRKHMDKNMYEFEAVHAVIGKMVCALYAMESMLQFTAGLIDQFEDQDCSMEKAVTELFCATECVKQIYEGLKLIGPQAYLQGNPYMQVFQDALALTTFDSYIIDSKTYIGLLGLQYLGKNYSNHVRKIRNPLYYPTYILKNVLLKNNDIKLRINEYVHPSLYHSADQVEKCVNKLHYASLYLLQQFGANVAQKQFEIIKLSEITCLLYASVAIMTRASRSYCIGLRNAQLEAYISTYFTSDAHKKITLLKEDIDSGSRLCGNAAFQQLSEAVFQKKGYCLEHPLSRTY